MSDPRPINPSRCWVRHIRRTVIGETGITIGQGAFIADTVEDLGGREGWQSGSVVFALSDDGEGTFRFPNAAGADGRLHRRRFALLTNSAYRIGEEWLEVYRDNDELVAVITPRSYSLSKAELVIKGPDVAGVLGRFRAGDADDWLGAAPRDVFEHYTRAEVLAWGSDLLGLTGIPASGGVGGASGVTPEGVEYSLGPNATASAGPNGETVLVSPTAAGAGLGRNGIPIVAADCWTVEARYRVTVDPEPDAILTLNVNADNNNTGLYLQVTVALATGDVTLTGFSAPGPNIGGSDAEVNRRHGLVPVGTHSIRVIAFYDRVLVFVDGELGAELRRPAPLRAPTRALAYVANATGVIEAVNVRSLAPFALRGADKGDLRLPGNPPPVGLRARLYSHPIIAARYATTSSRAKRLPARVGDEPTLERLDPTVAFTVGGAIAPTLAGNLAAIVWTGAIYLDLAASDRRLQLTSNGRHRLYVGKCRPSLDEAIDNWLSTTTTATAPLRSLLGSQAGWYPIRIEAFGTASALTVLLEDGAADAGGVVASYATVPQSRLSPIGTFDELVRLESHREMIGRIAQDFGYQWRVDPRQLESGEFPGQIIPRVRVGADYDLRVTVDRAVDVVVEGDAGDAVDRLVADAAGIADPKGSGQLNAELIDLDNARAHAFMHADYESLSEISEAPMLATRIGSLLALRSGVNENVGARPDGQRDLLDTFPLTGASSRMDWRPGDGVLLDLDDVDVRDTGPRQLTRIEWPIVPAGYGRPVVGFRQRPRDPAAVLRRALRVAINGQRNYQGTLVAVTGSHGGQNGVGAAADGAVDGYSRILFPVDPSAIAAAFLHVQFIAGTWTIAINGTTTGLTINAPGPYDVTRWIANEAGAGRSRAFAHLFAPNPATAASSYSIKLALIIRV
jgi:hypothetical protein